MHNAQRMKGLDSEAHLDQNLQYNLLLEHLVPFPQALDSVRQISTVRVLHDEATKMKSVSGLGGCIVWS